MLRFSWHSDLHPAIEETESATTRRKRRRRPRQACRGRGHAHAGRTPSRRPGPPSRAAATSTIRAPISPWSAAPSVQLVLRCLHHGRRYCYRRCHAVRWRRRRAAGSGRRGRSCGGGARARCSRSGRRACTAAAARPPRARSPPCTRGTASASRRRPTCGRT